MSAKDNLRKFLANSSNRNIATTLELAITGTSDDARELRNIENYIREEARKRVGPAANRASDLAWEAFNAKYGITKDMSEAQLDAIFDQIPESEFVPGEWFFLVAELRK